MKYSNLSIGDWYILKHDFDDYTYIKLNDTSSVIINSKMQGDIGFICEIKDNPEVEYATKINYYLPISCDNYVYEETGLKKIKANIDMPWGGMFSIKAHNAYYYFIKLPIGSLCFYSDNGDHIGNIIGDELLNINLYYENTSVFKTFKVYERETI